MKRVAKIFPFLRWWPMVNRTTTRADLTAGLTGAILGLPQGVAFAILAGVVRNNSRCGYFPVRRLQTRADSGMMIAWCSWRERSSE